MVSLDIKLILNGHNSLRFDLALAHPLYCKNNSCYCEYYFCTINSVGQGEDMELLMLDLSTIARATSEFSPNKKLGEGGFGLIYKVNLQQ
jgi:hypothetical protein